MRRTLASWAILLGVVAFACLPLAALAQRRGGVPFGLNWNRGRTVATGPLLSMALTGNCEGTTPAGLTFSRTSTAICTQANGILTTVAAGQPRLEAQGLLVEGAATNLLLRSSELGVAPWSLTNITISAPVVTADAALAPDGTMTAERVDFAAVAGGNQISALRQSLTMPDTSVSSIYARAVSGTATFYLNASGGGTQTAAPCTATESAWVRCAMPKTTVGNTVLDIGTNSFSGIGPNTQPAASVYLWGAQVESGPVATSYIPTQGTQVTRQPSVPYAAWPVASGSWTLNETVCLYPGAVVRTPIWLSTTDLNTYRAFVTFDGSGWFANGTATLPDASAAGACRRLQLEWDATTRVMYLRVYNGAALAGQTQTAVQAGDITDAARLYIMRDPRSGFDARSGGRVSQICLSGPAGGCQ